MKPTALPPWGKSLLLLAGVALLAAGLRLLSAHNLALLHPAHTVAGIGLFTLIAAAGCAVGLPRQLTASAAASIVPAMTGVPSASPRTSAMRPMTLSPGRCPPVPVLAP